MVMRRSAPEIYTPVTATTGTWAFTTGDMTSKRFAHAAVLLLTGKVLIAGGDNFTDPGFSGGGIGVLSSAELYDPVAKTFAATGAMAVERQAPAAVRLASGKVLVAGGDDGDDGIGGVTDYVKSAEIYDPAAATWSPTGDMSVERLNHTITPLHNGTVLVTGGSSNSVVLTTAEIFDPATGTWTLVGSMGTLRDNHSATLLLDGTVLIVGGGNSGGELDTAEIYDPVAKTFSPVAAVMTEVRTGHAATLQSDGTVLISGGFGGVSPSIPPSSVRSTAETYTPGTGLFAAADTMTVTRARHPAPQLLDGSTLVLGGDTSPSVPLMAPRSSRGR